MQARLYSVHDEAYKSELPAENTEIKMTALTMEGNALIFAFMMAMAKGDELAVPIPPKRLGEV